MAFRILGLSPERFVPLYGQSDDVLAAHGAIRYVADSMPGFPDRVELRDAEPGETLLLVNYEHQPAATPYRARHAIFVREGATRAAEFVDQVPELLRRRPISLRAFDARHMMVDAELVDGCELGNAIETLFSNGAIAYLQAHLAKRGCYAARVERG